MKAPTIKNDMFVMLIFSVVVLTMPLWLEPLGANYPDLLQKFA
ncbi:MAG: branched-chain amino acid ABC transporter permease, partial [Gammaproteobacteria bacterium]|nr:branched-chain amino acid ABC transporter permease [Gammaproteobacteria bacterium]